MSLIVLIVQNNTMPQPQKPCILFSCGAFHRASCFDACKQKLEADGLNTVLVSTHPSLGPDSAGKTMWDDTKALQAQMSPYMDEGCEFIIIGHSYGGYPAFATAEGWTVKERAALGKKGGVRAVVFFAATVPIAAGMTPIHVFGPGTEILYPPIFDHGPVGIKVRRLSQNLLSCAPSLTLNQGQLCHSNAISKYAFYHEMSPGEADERERLLLPHSQDAFETPVNYTVHDAEVALYYIISEKDEAIPAEVQRRVASRIPNCTVLSIDAGHSAFITQPDRFAELIGQVVDDLSGVA